MVGVVTAVGGQVEGDRQTLLAGSEVAAVEGIGLRGSRESRVLPNGPRLVHVHRRVRAAKIRNGTGHAVERIGMLAVGGDGITVRAGVQRTDVDLLGSGPRDLLGRIAMPLSEISHELITVSRCRDRGPSCQRDVGEIVRHRLLGRGGGRLVLSTRHVSSPPRSCPAVLSASRSRRSRSARTRPERSAHPSMPWPDRRAGRCGIRPRERPRGQPRRRSRSAGWPRTGPRQPDLRTSPSRPRWHRRSAAPD